MIYQVETPNDPVASLLQGLLGIEAIIGELIGMNCSPITVVGLGGTNCMQQTLCCTGNSYVSIEYFFFVILPSPARSDDALPPRTVALGQVPSSTWAAPRLTLFFNAFGS